MGSTICWGESVCENEIRWIPYVTFIQKTFNFCIDCTYLSVYRVNVKGENRISHLNFGQNFIVRHPIICWFVCIQYRVFLSLVINEIEQTQYKIMRLFCV